MRLRDNELFLKEGIKMSAKKSPKKKNKALVWIVTILLVGAAAVGVGLLIGKTVLSLMDFDDNVVSTNTTDNNDNIRSLNIDTPDTTTTQIGNEVSSAVTNVPSVDNSAQSQTSTTNNTSSNSTSTTTTQTQTGTAQNTQTSSVGVGSSSQTPTTSTTPTTTIPNNTSTAPTSTNTPSSQVTQQTTPPTIEIAPPQTTSTTMYKVRVGSYSNRQDAVDLSAELEAMGLPIYVTGTAPYSVQVGSFSKIENAAALRDTLIEQGYKAVVSE